MLLSYLMRGVVSNGCSLEVCRSPMKALSCSPQKHRAALVAIEIGGPEIGFGQSPILELRYFDSLGFRRPKLQVI
jgi:hypothetical protein